MKYNFMIYSYGISIRKNNNMTTTITEWENIQNIGKFVAKHSYILTFTYVI